MKRIVSKSGKLNSGKKVCAVVMLCATTAIALSAQTFTPLHSFDGTDGLLPFAGLVQATNGDLYGTTTGGGPNGGGAVFKITPGGTLKTVYSFCARTQCTDGYESYAGLVQATNGDLYGTTTYGGNSTNYPCDFFHGCGTVFKITPSGTLTTLYSFCAQSGCPDGYFPYAGLVQANGNLYGTASGGGANNCGTVFKITPSGTLTTLHGFCSQSGDGYYPNAGLIQAINGDLYGTTTSGGSSGGGTVFKITPSGTLTTLYSFCSQSGCTDGEYPTAGLVQAANGDFYGTTVFGGANTCPPSTTCGTVFRITPSGTLTTLHSFCSQSGCTDGANPYGGLVQATNGDLYGTTFSGGANDICQGLGNPLPGCGTLFKITPSGTLTTLYSLCSQANCTDGQNPYAGLVQFTNGNFYGTTTGSAGNFRYGTVFSLSVGLGPFVETRPTAGKVGAPVTILGSDLTGATSVSFNGTAATFTVVSRYLIKTTVPAGATTGKVEVVTPGGTLSTHNVVFRVP